MSDHYIKYMIVSIFTRFVCAPFFFMFAATCMLIAAISFVDENTDASNSETVQIESAQEELDAFYTENR